jgi:polyvinyl alcohol dehydrogenase (cytochrome)
MKELPQDRWRVTHLLIKGNFLIPGETVEPGLPAPAGVPVWNTPTIDASRHAVYVGTGDASTYPAPPTSDAILALDMTTGKVRWSKQIYPHDSFIVGCGGTGFTDNCPKVLGPDWDIPMSPMLKTKIHRATNVIIINITAVVGSSTQPMRSACSPKVNQVKL